jgi:putative transposase
VVKDEQMALSAEGISFFFLPAYCPALNDIEPLWRQVKYQDLPDRSHETEASLRAAVETALRGRDEAMRFSNTALSASA